MHHCWTDLGATSVPWEHWYRSIGENIYSLRDSLEDMAISLELPILSEFRYWKLEGTIKYIAGRESIASRFNQKNARSQSSE
jgi:hypothetical protein